MPFPIDLNAFKPLALDPSQAELSDDQREQLESNIQLCRDVIVFFTAVAEAKGLGGHTGGPYDIVPEVMVADAFMRGSDKVVPIYFDEAGHRVAIQYLMSVLNGEMDAEKLLHYREFESHLPGHPERDFTPGVKFSSGRLGHMWPYCNGVAMAHPGKAVIVFGSDGSQQEGNDAEAARLAVAQGLNIKLIVDDNDVTIAGKPSEYLPGYDVAQTLQGHGLTVYPGEGEDLDSVYRRVQQAVNTDGPAAVVNKRTMAVGIDPIQGTPEGHDVIKHGDAIDYLQARGGYDKAIDYLKDVKKGPSQPKHRGSSEKQQKNRSVFGKVMARILEEMDPAQREQTVRVFDCDLEGSTGINAIREACPDIYVKAGIMERGNFSAAAGFGYEQGKQGIVATFSAFLEMCISEITMARLNKSNVLAHFSHAGVDDMADNTCHFGINNMFADGGLPDFPDKNGDTTRLYFPADANQMTAVLRRVFTDPGLRFVFSNRSSTPLIFKDDGSELFGEGYTFEPGRDDIVREGKDGYVVSFGSTLYRALDAVEQLREKGVDVGLVNKCTLNVIDEDTIAKVGKTGFVLVAEEFNVNTGLGSRFGSALLRRGLTPRFDHIGVHAEGSGGLWRQMGHQGLDSAGIAAAVKKLAKR